MTAAVTAGRFTLAVMGHRKTDMEQIRKRGNSYQVNVYAGLREVALSPEETADLIRSRLTT
jgi:hypothetical protein